MAKSANPVYRWKGREYVPFHTVRLAAGPFLSATPDSVEQYVELPTGLHSGVQDHYVGGIRTHRDGLAAAHVYGDSMIDRNILHGDIAIFQRMSLTMYKTAGLIEKLGEEEGLGAWALKKLVIERPGSSHRSECEDEINWDDPAVVLYSSNPRVSPSRLHSSGQYRVHGRFLRSLRRHDVSFVDLDWIRCRAADP